MKQRGTKKDASGDGTGDSRSSGEWHTDQQRTEKEKGRVAVVVVGEIGRNPRMQYHALSLAEHFEGVDLVGYKGPPPCPQLESNPSIVSHFLPSSPTSTTPIAHGLFSPSS